MKIRMVLTLAVALSAIVAALAFSGDQPSYTMVKVGGANSHCECTYRLER